MKHFLIASILLTVIPALAFQAAPPQTAGFAVSGKVLQDPDGQPVKKANVTLIGQSGRQTGPYSAVTDAEGQFAIANVKAGRYIVEIEHAGMVQNGNGRISLSVVQNKNDLVFRVQRAALIIGKITDSDGDPVRNVSVTATRLDSGRPANRYASFGSGTNDLGEFRIPDLRAGKYTVVATPPQGLQAPEPDEKGKAREQVVYVATYYPGTLDKEESLPVDVQAGSETPVDITILSSKSYRVTGEVVGLPSKSLISTILLTSGHDMNSQQRLEEGGRFEFTGLLPGTYHARAVVVTGLREGGTPDMRLMQLEPTIDVVNADITEMHLHAVPAASIYGRFRMDTGQKFDWTRVMVFLRRDVSDRDMFRGRAARFASRTAEPAVSSRVLLLPGADAQSLSCAGGGSGHGHRTSLPASGTSGRLKIRPCGRPWRRAYGSGSLTPMPTFRTVVPSHLWLGTGPPGLHSSIPPHSRGVKNTCLGLQTYSCRLCLSREKHYRLYP